MQQVHRAHWGGVAGLPLEQQPHAYVVVHEGKGLSVGRQKGWELLHFLPPWSHSPSMLPLLDRLQAVNQPSQPNKTQAQIQSVHNPENGDSLFLYLKNSKT